MSEKIGDLSQELGNEIDKIKIIQSMSPETTLIENDKNDAQTTDHSMTGIPMSMAFKEEKFGKDQFSLRNQLYSVERKLKMEIQQRTSILAKGTC